MCCTMQLYQYSERSKAAEGKGGYFFRICGKYREIPYKYMIKDKGRMKRFIACIAAVLTIGTAFVGCAEKKKPQSISEAEEDDDDDEVLDAETASVYAAKGKEINGKASAEEVINGFIDAVKAKKPADIVDLVYIRDELQYFMPVDEGVFGLLYKQALNYIADSDYKIEYIKEAGKFTAEELEDADDIVNTDYVYSNISEEVTGGGRELTEDERKEIISRIKLFDFDFKEVEKPLKVTEGQHYEAGIAKGDDKMTIMFSLYKVNDEKWLMLNAEW